MKARERLHARQPVMSNNSRSVMYYRITYIYRDPVIAKFHQFHHEPLQAIDLFQLPACANVHSLFYFITPKE